MVSLGDIDIYFICFDDLIQGKEATSRAKDLLDIEQLTNKKNDNSQSPSDE
ncbi:MAG: hypothetical protein ACKVTZ_00350 [Bacteroidia bacterium]